MTKLEVAENRRLQLSENLEAAALSARSELDLVIGDIRNGQNPDVSRLWREIRRVLELLSELESWSTAMDLFSESQP